MSFPKSQVGMRIMPLRTLTIISALALGPGLARAGEITFSWHEFTGSGTANVFDGGPPVTQSGTISGPDLAGALFSVSDDTRPGSFGAGATASGSSLITLLDDALGIDVRLDTDYSSSLFGGGDNPGGMAEGSLTSVIEFVMPVDELEWIYGLGIDQRDPFDGSTSVIFENVTRSQILLNATSPVPTTQTILSAEAGDVMRLTTVMSGSGTMGPGSMKLYQSELQMIFTIPEPGTTGFILFGVSVTIARRPRRKHKQ